MHRESWKVFLACAIGAGIGSLVALEMHPMLWWVGLIVGFATGYLSYEWRAVLRAVPEAWRMARGWTLPPRYFDLVVWSLAWLLNVIIVLAAAFSVGLLLIDASDLSRVLVAMQIFVLFSFCLFGGVLVMHHMEARREAPSADACVHSMKQAAILTFPPVIVFFVLPYSIVWCVRRIPTAIGIIAYGVMAFVRFLRAFAWQLFLHIHSELRLLCGVDAMLGTIVGYFSGSALVGACIGGAFGVLNYAVVTKRILEPCGYLPIRP